MARGEALTSAGLPVVPVVSWRAGGRTRAGVGENQAGVAGGAGERTCARAGFTGGVTPCGDSKDKRFCSSKRGSGSKFHCSTLRD